MIHNLTPDQLRQVCRDWEQPEWRAGQIWHWLYRNLVDDWDAMRNLPRTLRVRLSEQFCITPIQSAPTEFDPASLAAKKISATLVDGEIIETVLINAPSRQPSGPTDGMRRTVCVSTQAGCKFNCAFCASGKRGFKRDLCPAEIIGQILAFARLLNRSPGNVVFMGIGEPLDNYDNTMTAIRILNNSDGLNIGARRITVSTCGIIPGIRRLADEGMQIELSVSLHAPDDDLRSQLMPVNRRYGLGELMEACREYTRRTKRIITFEYTLIDQVNSSEHHARKLTQLLRGSQCRVNLIPLSPVAEFTGRPPDAVAAHSFMRILKNVGINTTLRQSRGAGINAACGQLRLSQQQ